MTLLLTPAPYRAYALAAQAFYPDRRPCRASRRARSSIRRARLGEGCAVEPNAVIGAGAEIGRRCLIGANAVIGAAASSATTCASAPMPASATASSARACGSIPACASARTASASLPIPTGHVKVPQLGRVIIGDDVEIGANSTIDRGAGPDTVIGAGTMIDNLVQIGHNVQIGPRLRAGGASRHFRQHAARRFRHDRRTRRR